jgi:uncharacterized protein YoxC
MKKILYFLIGFSLVAFPVRYAFAVDDFTCEGACPSAGASSAYDYFYDSQNLSSKACVTFLGYSEQGTTHPTVAGSACSPGLESSINEASVQGGQYYYMRGLKSPDGTKWAWWILVPVGDCASCASADADNDGLPDDCDQYPNDATPYTVQKRAYYTTTSASYGDPVREDYRTDRGDFFYIGASDRTGLYTTLVLNGPWIDPSTLCDPSTLGGGTTAPTDSDPHNVPATYPTNDDGTPSTGDPTIPTGTDPTPGQGDSTTLEGIQGNTKDITDGIGGLAAYLKDINSKVGGIERDTASLGADVRSLGNDVRGFGTGITNIDTGITDLNTGVTGLNDNITGVRDDLGSLGDSIDEIKDALTGDAPTITPETMPDFDQAVQDTENQFSDDPSLNELPDSGLFDDMDFKTKYDYKTPLTNLINDNPVTDIINGIDIDFSGEPYFIWSYNGRNVEFTVAPYQSQLNLWGQIMLGFSSICALLIMLKR